MSSDLRGKLAEALHRLWNDRLDHGGKVCASCLEDVDDALLPIARKFAADQLQQAADAAEDVGWWPHARSLRARAAALEVGQ